MDEKLADLINEFNRVAVEWNEIIEDLKWRKDDVAHENAEYRTRKESDEESDRAWALARGPTIKILDRVLEKKIARAEELEKRYSKLREEIEERSGSTIEELIEGEEISE